MKEMIKDAVGLIAMLFAFIVLPGIAGYVEHHYNRTGTVTRVNETVAEVEDTTGIIWEFNVDENSVSVGDEVKLKMYNNCTDSVIQDDEVVDFEIIQ